ncbi:outer membrane immunogenic protein [Sphingomonas sp. PP-F2F-G114-C0414]|uniref:opacity protein n=1 Tax=Sphingomonas sp. PP-F2F-G114-C0414 TaxID=2135662 RepID=UPI000EF96000|nr:opacity protein [Sphingomonas sp. PP-F2F-G114-C0414]RMB34355.1 outer membrane immunogenic protein [Sphingomonas sp. PP-F2F-G114-C0414]
MRTLSLALVLAATAFAAPVFAQDMAAPAPVPADNSAAPGEAAAPDGSKAFGIEPYVGIMGGWEQFDNVGNHGIPRALNSDGSVRNNYRADGALVQGVVGVNVPLGPVFVGVEGNVIKGVDGNIDWEYGAAGRFGFRAGDSGIFYGKVGYQWVNFDHFAQFSTNGGRTNRDYNAVTYGIGAEVGPQSIGLKGITGNAGFRIRAEVNTFGTAQSFRPMLGIITHF